MRFDTSAHNAARAAAERALLGVLCNDVFSSCTMECELVWLLVSCLRSGGGCQPWTLCASVFVPSLSMKTSSTLSGWYAQHAMQLCALVCCPCGPGLSLYQVGCAPHAHAVPLRPLRFGGHCGLTRKSHTVRQYCCPFGSLCSSAVYVL
jgi:hypothetical protein